MSITIENCQAPPAIIRAPRRRAPALSCDCHFHIFGPYDRYPLSAGRTYTPPEASLAQYRSLAGTLGIERMVVVQPSVYGTDNACTLNAVAAFGIARARAVAVIDAGFDLAALHRLNDAGVRGVRFNAVSGNGTPLDQLDALARRIAPLGWHLQLYLDGAALHDLAPHLASLPVEVVIDHIGGTESAAGVGDTGFQALLRLLGTGRAWVKLCGYRSSSAGYPFTDVAPLACALIEAAPERCVWGTDWPHPNYLRTMPDAGELLDLLDDWAGSDSVRRRILVDNPARLYGFA
jgi:predicted TIM-barrel fold metal-dependent hydrolase